MKHALALTGLLLIGAAQAAEPNCWDTTGPVAVNCWDTTGPVCQRTDCICTDPGKCPCDPKVSCPEQCPMLAKDYKWVTTADGTQAGLYCHGKQVGTYRFRDDAFRPLDGDRWGDYGKPPIPVPPLLLTHFRETCGGGASSQSSTPQYDPFQGGEAPAEAGDSGYQSGGNTGSRGPFMQRGPLRRLIGRVLGR